LSWRCQDVPENRAFNFNAENKTIDFFLAKFMKFTSNLTATVLIYIHIYVHTILNLDQGGAQLAKIISFAIFPNNEKMSAIHS